jgi:mercuric ion binding protein
MKWLLPVLMILPTFAFAETTTYEVSGMTCNSCVKALKAKVCKLDGVEKCEISVGKMILTPKAGATLDQQKVSEAVTSAGAFKVTSSAAKK